MFSGEVLPCSVHSPTSLEPLNAPKVVHMKNGGKLFFLRPKTFFGNDVSRVYSGIASGD